MLAGIYTHTSSHIVAAPMAHYMALHGSRFRYSHDYAFLPVHGIEQLLHDNPMVMKFRSVGGRQVAYHAAMDWWYRPTELDHLSAYEFYSQLESVNREKNQEESFEFQSEHPLSSSKVMRYRKSPCIPVFSWNWIGSTRQFSTSLLDPVDPNHHDFSAKELYAKRFMILFMPFNPGNSITIDGSYQKSLQDALEGDIISSDMLQIAENIQAIHNSLASSMPENILTAETDEYIEADDVDEHEEECYSASLEAMLTNIGSTLAEGVNDCQLKEECKELIPTFFNPAVRNTNFDFPNPSADINVIDTDQDDHMADSASELRDNTCRFRTTVSQLNSLVMQRYTDGSQTDTQSEHGNNVTTTPGPQPNDPLTEQPKVHANGSWQSIIAWGRAAKLDTEQQTAHEILTATYVLTFMNEAISDEPENRTIKTNREKLRKLARHNNNTDKPLRMFVTGPAGAGKCKSLVERSWLHPAFTIPNHILSTARLLEAVLVYCKLYSQHLGHHFTSSTIRVSALTGAAATEIGGETTAREFQLRSKKTSADMDDLRAFSDTRLCVVDEISFADYDKDLAVLSSNLQMFTECHEHQFGNVAIVFLGDFCQLESIGGNCIYKQENGIYWEQALTCMVELKGTHRYKDCPIMQEIMPAWRENGLSEKHRKLLNTRVISSTNELQMPDLATTRFATYYNRNRVDINATIFHEYLKKYHSNCNMDNIPKTAVVIKTNPSWARSEIPLSFGHRKIFFEQCSEADTKNSYNKRCDPMLCLWHGCNLMGTGNDDVRNGIANGTTSTFQKVRMKPGKSAKPMRLHGYWVLSVDITDVEYLLLRWQDCRFQGTFKVFPSRGRFRVQFPITEWGTKLRVAAGIKLDYFPVILNHATTGHKLQGKSLSELVVAQWTKVKNWAYVVTSRVRTFDGLFFIQSLPKHFDFKPAPEYLSMMSRLRQKILAIPEQVADLYREYNRSNPTRNTQ